LIPERNLDLLFFFQRPFRRYSHVKPEYFDYFRKRTGATRKVQNYIYVKKKKKTIARGMMRKKQKRSNHVKRNNRKSRKLSAPVGESKR
jgi:hypothetical protein